MKVCGWNHGYRLGGSLNNNIIYSENIRFPGKSLLDVSSLLSFSTYDHSVWINQKNEAFAVGSNTQGQISSTLPKEKFSKDTQINLQFKNGQQCKFISAVAGSSYTLYQVLGEKLNDPSQLVLAYEDEETIFINIGKRSPLSLYGGPSTSSVIDTEGSVIIITNSIYDSPNSEVECLSFPDGEKAVKAAFIDESLIVLSESGRVFECSLEAVNKSFSEVIELRGTKITEISGTFEHIFCISNKGQIFGRGSNQYSELGLPSDMKKVDKFVVIESLLKYNVVEAYAGLNHSLFRTSEGKIVGCGFNYSDDLMIKSGNKKRIYPPEETLITNGATFCITGNLLSVVFVGIPPPINTPNRKIEPKLFNDIEKVTKITDEVNELRKQVLEQSLEISSLKKKLSQSKELIKKLESENNRLSESCSSTTKNKKNDYKLEVIDTSILDGLKRIKLLGRGATSEVFEVARVKNLH